MKQILPYYSPLHISGSDNSMVRLVGGSRQGEGRLEINTGNGWGSVCPHREWSATNAAALCKELCG